MELAVVKSIFKNPLFPKVEQKLEQAKIYNIHAPSLNTYSINSLKRYLYSFIMEEIINEEVYSNDACINDFCDFYSKVVSSSLFLKVPNSEIENEKDTGKYSQYKILFAKDKYAILYSNPILDKFVNSIYMIADPNDSHRYFMGVVMKGSYTSIKIFGHFIYFNSAGKVSELIIVPRVLLDYDYRNGRVDEKTTFLYNQSLIFMESHRDSHVYMITVCCFDYQDELLGTHKEYSQIKSKYFMDNPLQCCKRFLTFMDEKQTSYVIDMGSTIVTTEENKEQGRGFFNSKPSSKSSFMKYTMYKYEINKEINYEALQENPEPSYSDGYVSNCIKCGTLTGCAVYHESNGQIGYTTLGLGNSYCHDCGIRYSRSDNVWTCAKLLKEPYISANFCRTILTKQNGYVCGLEHNTCELNYDYTMTEKKPYKKTGYLTILRKGKSGAEEEEDDEE